MTAMSTQPESNDRGRLPRSINKLVPTPGPDAQRITALLRDGGRISGYQLENGRVLSKEERELYWERALGRSLGD